MVLLRKMESTFLPRNRESAKPRNTTRREIVDEAGKTLQ
jgi:hypothetical protein